MAGEKTDVSHPDQGKGWKEIESADESPDGKARDMQMRKGPDYGTWRTRDNTKDEKK